MGTECPKCKGTRRIKINGTIQPCWDCLNSGEMDQHSKDIKESKIKI
ncbi:MAG: hypothetical protein Q8O84_03770 [Nanoarchaeota archaeon]|nr:hypothetical protein [Nanoarchaeota archaeon]